MIQLSLILPGNARGVSSVQGIRTSVTGEETFEPAGPPGRLRISPRREPNARGNLKESHSLSFGLAYGRPAASGVHKKSFA